MTLVSRNDRSTIGSAPKAAGGVVADSARASSTRVRTPMGVTERQHRFVAGLLTRDGRLPCCNPREWKEPAYDTASRATT